MIKLKSIEEANEVSTVRLVSKRQRAKVGDIFRLSPLADIFLWGRLIKRAKFFGIDAEFSLVYIYDAIGEDRPSSDLLSPQNLIIGPSVVNNLGWSRGYWEIGASEPVKPADMLDHHNFIRFHGTGSTRDYDIIDEKKLEQCSFHAHAELVNGVWRCGSARRTVEPEGVVPRRSLVESAAIVGDRERCCTHLDLDLEPLKLIGLTPPKALCSIHAVVDPIQHSLLKLDIARDHIDEKLLRRLGTDLVFDIFGVRHCETRLSIRFISIRRSKLLFSRAYTVNRRGCARRPDTTI